MEKNNFSEQDLRGRIEALERENGDYRQLRERYENALQQLKEKEEFNFALFQYNPAATIVVDRDGRVVRSNTAKRHMDDRLPNIGDIMYRDYACKHTINMYEQLIACMRENATRHYPNMKYGNKFLSITIAPFPKGAIIACQDVTAQRRAEQDRINLIADLQKALDEVETLRGLLPICASCKNVRDDKGYWNTIEDYISTRVHIDFSHTVCPDCVKKLYPDMWEKLSRREVVERA